MSFAPDGKRVAFLRAGKLWTMNPDGTDEKVLVERPAGASTTTGRPTGSGSSTRGWTARSPASCTFVPATASRRSRGAQRHPLRHLQRRRHLEQRRQEAGVRQPAPQRPRPSTSCRCRSRPRARHAPEHKRRSTGTTSTCASSSAAPHARSRIRGASAHGRQPGRLPRRSATSGDDLWVARSERRPGHAADDRQRAADADPVVAAVRGPDLLPRRQRAVRCATSGARRLSSPCAVPCHGDRVQASPPR